MPLFPSPANFIWKDHSAWCPKCHRQKRAFLFLKNHFLTQGFGLSMHKIYKKKKKHTHTQKTKNRTWERHQWQHLPLAQGIRAVKEDTTDIANPFPSQPKNKCALQMPWTAMDIWLRTAYICFTVNLTHTLTGAIKWSLFCCTLSIYTLNWADQMFHYPP